MEELKEQALKLGLEFKGNISKAELTNMIEDAKNQNADDSSEDIVDVPEKPKKIKVIITPRDSQEKDGYVGLNGYKASFQFDEEIEMPEDVVEFLKSKGTYNYKPTKDGLVKKWESRFIVEKV